MSRRAWNLYDLAAAARSPGLPTGAALYAWDEATIAHWLSLPGLGIVLEGDAARDAAERVWQLADAQRATAE